MGRRNSFEKKYLKNLEREEGREKERERNIDWLPSAFCKHADREQSTEPASQAHALIGNHTGDL